ncbi:phage tail protein [Hafnia alvei]|uniref:phage tail protein n=1 Tax=Hafnia alvei TaxID=569 RepID=UPI0036F967B0
MTAINFPPLCRSGRIFTDFAMCNCFSKNLGLPEVSANGKNFVSDGGHRRITAGDGTHQAVLSDTGYFGVKDKDGSVWEFNPSGVLIAGSVPVSRLTGTNEITVPVGTVIMVAHNKQVAGRLLRTNGTAVSRTAYADLFAAIGTTYGAGDGSTTFNLPDTRDDFPRFAGDSRSVGSKQGDAMRNIVGSYATAKPNTSTILNHASGPFKIVEDTSQWYSVQTAPSVGSNHVMMFNLENTSLPLASENRPRNIALAGWIRY